MIRLSQGNEATGSFSGAPAMNRFSPRNEATRGFAEPLP